MNPERIAMSIDQKTDYEPVIIEIPSLGYGSGKISRQAQLDSGELTLADQEKGIDYVKNNASYVVVEVDDDGCGDGRVSIKIIQLTENGLVEFKRSAYRAKVFGGGATMASVALLGLGEISENAEAQFNLGIETLDELGIKYGAHDDEHANAPFCGCGAIDKYPEIILATQLFREDIKNSLIGLFGDDFDEAIFNNVMVNYLKAANVNFDSYAGLNVKNAILDKGAVVKKLGGNHQEDFVILNFIKGTTFNQYGLYEYTNNKVQAFSVDVWRLQEYAEKISQHKKGSNKVALYSMLIYTLATSAVLTDGSQKVFIHR